MTITYGAAQESPPESYDSAIQVANQISGQASQILAQAAGITQHETLYNLLYNKNLHTRELKKSLKNNFSGKIYLTDHIFHAVRHIPENSTTEFFNMQSAPASFENSIVIFSNNNVMVDNTLDKFIQLYRNSPTSLFVVWDFDNHHWFALSSMLATFSDVYVPTHNDNLDFLSRYNNYIVGPVSSGTIQWTREYIQEHKNIITDTERSDEPLGTHIEYPQFPLRQRNLQDLQKKFSKVKLVDGSYHSRDMLDRFTEWCSHKVHWIVPVLNDAPIRLYDALITGGIPIVPRSLKYHRDVIKLHDHILFYDHEDIQNPYPITEKAIQMFNDRGLTGVLDRSDLVCYNHHVDNRVETILKEISNEFELKL